MVYIDIPYFAENDRVDKIVFQNELECIGVSKEEQNNILNAVYTLKPAGISFENSDIEKAILLVQVFWRFGIGYRMISQRTDQ